MMGGISVSFYSFSISLCETRKREKRCDSGNEIDMSDLKYIILLLLSLF
jgi:hypothetical protein